MKIKIVNKSFSLDDENINENDINYKHINKILKSVLEENLTNIEIQDDNSSEFLSFIFEQINEVISNP